MKVKVRIGKNPRTVDAPEVGELWAHARAKRPYMCVNDRDTEVIFGRYGPMFGSRSLDGKDTVRMFRGLGDVVPLEPSHVLKDGTLVLVEKGKRKRK